MTFQKAVEDTDIVLPSDGRITICVNETRISIVATDDGISVVVQEQDRTHAMFVPHVRPERNERMAHYMDLLQLEALGQVRMLSEK
jgi:hypothetical protein